jgi:hypothetical protein
MPTDARPCLDETVVLKNHEALRAACDFAVYERWSKDDLPLAGEQPLSVFLDRLGEMGDGAVVYLKTDNQEAFFSAAFPRIKSRFVLVTDSEDFPTPGPHRPHLDDPRIIRWFGQNCDLPGRHPKYEPIPIGFADSRHPHGDQRAILRVHRRMPSVADKPLKAYATFHLNLSHPERRRARDILRPMPHVFMEPRRIPPELLWIRHANCAFEISPRGNGLDCHRTWEALLLRTIPIVRASSLDPLYDGLPVAIVSDWDEVTLEAMSAWRSRFAGCFTAETFQRITLGYWVNRIRSAAAPMVSASQQG